MEHRLTISGRYDCLAQVCDLVEQSAVEAGLGKIESQHCQLAVDEACTNIIEHGYGGEDLGVIDILCEAHDGELVITLQDQAKQFDPSEVPAPNLKATLDELKVGGLGLYFMRQVMDAVEFSYEGGGNKVVLVKHK